MENLNYQLSEESFKTSLIFTEYKAINVAKLSEKFFSPQDLSFKNKI